MVRWPAPPPGDVPPPSSFLLCLRVASGAACLRPQRSSPEDGEDLTHRPEPHVLLATGMVQGGCRAPWSVRGRARQTQTMLMLSLMARTSLAGLYTTVATTPRPRITLREIFLFTFPQRQRQRRTSLHLSRTGGPVLIGGVCTVHSERCLCRVVESFRYSFCLCLLALVCAAVGLFPVCV